MDQWCQDAAAGRVHACHHLALTESSDILGRWRSCFVIEALSSSGSSSGGSSSGSSSSLPLRHVRRSACCILMRSPLHALGLPGFTRICRPSPSHGRRSDCHVLLVGASQCLSRGREARPKCHRRYNLSCGCAVTVLPPVAPQVCEIHDSSLCFLSLERISSASYKKN